MPIRVIDIANQQEVEVSSEEAQQGFQQGRFALPGKQVRVAKGQNVGTVSSEDLLTAIGQGAKIVDDDEASRIKLQAEESTIAAQALATTEAAASGLTFGLSRMAEEAAGVDPERMRARREFSGPVGTVAEIAGAIAPAFVTGGAGLAGTAAKSGLAARALRATPAGLVERAGAAVERGLVRGLGETGVARTVVPVAGRGLVEGFAAGVGTEIDESVLGEREITAERLLASGGLGAVLGGAAGTVVPGLAAAGQGLGKVSAAPVRKLLGRAAGSAEDAGSGLAARLLTDENASRYARMVGADADAMRQSFKTLRERPDYARRLLDDPSTVTEEIATKVRDPVANLREAISEARIAVSGSRKAKNVERLLPGDLDSVARIPQMASEQIEQINARLADALTEAGEGLAEHSTADIRSIRRALNQARVEIEEAAGSAKNLTGAKRAAAAAQRQLDQVKQEADRIMGKLRKTAPSRAQQNTLDVLNDQIGGLRKHLEDEAIWGSAATAQAEVNRAASQAISQRGQLSGASKRLLDAKKALDNGDLMSVTRQSGRFSGSTKTELFEDVVASEIEFLDQVSKHYELNPEALAAVKKAKAAAKQIGDAFESQRDKVRTLDAFEKLRIAEGNRSVSIGALSTLGPTVGATLGASLGPVGAAAGALVGGITRPYTNVRRLASIMGRVDGVSTRQIDAVGAFVGKLARGTGKLVGKAARPLKRAPFVAAKLGTRSEKLKSSKENTAKYKTNPSQLADAVRRATIDLQGVAPNLSAEVGGKITAAVHYLSQHAPVSYQAPFSSSRPLVDPVAEAEYERRVDAVVDPIGTLELLEQGLFTKEHADTLKAVYPALYRDAQRQVMEALAEHQADEQEVPRMVAQQMSLLFEAPVDPTLPLAASISASLGTPAQQQPQQPQMANKPSKISKDFKIEPGRFRTDIQQLEAREEASA